MRRTLALCLAFGMLIIALPAVAQEGVPLPDQGGNEVVPQNAPPRAAFAGLPPFTSFRSQFVGKPETPVGLSGPCGMTGAYPSREATREARA